MALSACHSPRREARQMVRRAEHLADTLPDSTLCFGQIAQRGQEKLRNTSFEVPPKPKK